ncbi:MAG: hypothetical protein R3182_14810, partial [Draconibacterium sp.]|nr:hypothetical protein [Draconibacterium sp.]
MKRIVLLLLVSVFLINCKYEKTNGNAENFVPITQKLQSDIMTPEVLWSFGRIGGVDVSPNEEKVLFTITYYNIEENKSYRDIYTIPISGGKMVNITNTASNEFSAAWRPDGKKIGYLSVTSGDVQLWEMNPDGSNPKQISNIAGGISGFKYSPNLSKILYTKSVKLDNDIHDLFPDLPKANARLETDIMYRHWDTWHDYSYSHIFVADYSDGKIGKGIDIMEGEKFDSPMKPFGGTEQIVWSPDGSRHPRGVRLPRPSGLLRLLGGDARSDVLHHRDLGRQAPGLRGGEVLPLHRPGICADVCRDPGDGLHRIRPDRAAHLRLRRVARGRPHPHRAV